MNIVNIVNIVYISIQRFRYSSWRLVRFPAIHLSCRTLSYSSSGWV